MSLTAHSAEIHLSNAQMTDTGRGSEEATTITNDFETPFLKPLVGPLDMGDSRAVSHQPPITVLLPQKSHSEQLFKVFILLLVAVLSYFLGSIVGKNRAVDVRSSQLHVSPASLCRVLLQGSNQQVFQNSRGSGMRGFRRWK
eukprot:EG_transcript_42719